MYIHILYFNYLTKNQDYEKINYSVNSISFYNA